ncbi:DUF2062 domain-containing protein [Oceanibium sediminis]|uniref:DUF2062 domain-containing protein n=1 Tax=Oceanibium sediminis TaxID=2026339 RepID=UPI000DD3F756|nr:DUF2062 domain-containing protein [Oceanibium sediminis]
MVFKRRTPLSTARKIQDWIYPRTGWRRAIEYFAHRVKRLPDTPHKIALGFACGVFVSFSPLFGFHFLYAALVALIVRGNVLAACLGTLMGNPVTFPLIASAALTLGRQVYGLGGSGTEVHGVKDSFFGALAGLWESLLSLVGYGEPAWGTLSIFFYEVFLPYYVGGLVPGLITAGVCYFVSRPLVAAYQQRRRSRLLLKAQEKLAKKKADRAAASMAKEGSR